MLGLAIDLGHDGLMQAERRMQEPSQLRHAREARELQEDLVDVLADRLVRGQQPVIGVEARRLRVVVARAEMAVAAQSLLLAAHDHHELRVRLEAENAVHDVGTGLLELVRELDVRLLVEARAQLDDHRDVLAGLRRFHQCAHDRGVAAGTV